MTTNITYGNAAQFVAEFVDGNGNTTIPSGATLTIVYPVGLTSASTSITMTQINSFFTATWSSSVSNLDIATWTVTSVGSSLVAASGNLRIITP